MENIPLSNCWHYPTEVQFAAGIFQQLPTHIQQRSYASPLLVIDNFLLSLPTVQSVLSSLSHATIFSQFHGNPTGDDVQAGVQQLQQHHCDVVIAIGGGSAIDVAKIIALIAHQDCSLWDLEDQGQNYLRANSDVILPIIAIPTTAGTGSEVGRAAAIIHPESRKKYLIFHPKLLPSWVLCDPELTVSLPPSLTAATGLDALTHNIEALCAPGYHPMADGIAIEGARLVKENLLQAYQQPNDLVARSHMLSASLMGATAFQKGLGAVHALSHPVGGLFNAHHGLLNAIFLPYVLQFNHSHIGEKMCRLARSLELIDCNTQGVIAWIQQLNADLAIPDNLQAIGITQEQTDRIIDMALQDPSTGTNPIPLTASGCRALFEAAWQGDMQRVITP